MSKVVGFEVAKLAKQHGFNDKNCNQGYLHDGSESFDFTTDWLNAKAIGAPTQDELLSFLEGKGMFIPLMPEIYVDGINWNWQVLWYLKKEDWQYTEIDTENGRQKVPINIVDGTGWYGDNGEYPTRHDAIEAALKMGLMKLDPLFMNNSSERLAKAYGISMNELLTRIRPFSDELGDWSFREFTIEQMQIIVGKLGNPFQK